MTAVDVVYAVLALLIGLAGGGYVAETLTWKEYQKRLTKQTDESNKAHAAVVAALRDAHQKELATIKLIHHDDEAHQRIANLGGKALQAFELWAADGLTKILSTKPEDKQP